MEDDKVIFPYCANCLRKIKKEGLSYGEYYCAIVAHTAMNGVVTSDTDGTECVKKGLYLHQDSRQK
ncbi:MAG: hypothetical protein IKQ94_09455 [Bacteroidales bacterium]|nr:hypothetical protein [Bacteroidales bacterium]